MTQQSTTSIGNIAAELQRRIVELESDVQRYQLQAALAISLLNRAADCRMPGPLIRPVPIPPPQFVDPPSVRYNLEAHTQAGGRGRLSGWAFAERPTDEPAGAIVLFLRCQDDWWALPVLPVERPDVSKAFALKAKRHLHGFEAHFSLPQNGRRVTAMRIAISGDGWRCCSGEIPL